jgi:hypothetical protein
MLSFSVCLALLTDNSQKTEREAVSEGSSLCLRDARWRAKAGAFAYALGVAAEGAF